MLDLIYRDFAVEQAVKLLSIDSPSGYTEQAAQWVLEAFRSLGCEAHITTKGGVLACLGGKDADHALMLEAHTDTLGGMVAQIKSDGRLRITALGGMQAQNGEAENVKVYTRDGRVYEGTLQLINASGSRQRRLCQNPTQLRHHRGCSGRGREVPHRCRKAGHSKRRHRLLRSPHPCHRLWLYQEPLPGRQALRGHSAGSGQVYSRHRHPAPAPRLRPHHGL